MSRKLQGLFINYAGVLLVILLEILTAATAQAADYYWNVASGDWSTATNWLTSVEPTSTDNANIDNGGTANITQSGEVCNSLYLGNTNTGAVEMSSGSLTVSGTSYIGYSSTGTFTQTGGTNSISNYLYLGYNSGSSGTYNLSGSGQLNANYGYIGRSSTGAFTQTGGTNSISISLFLGQYSGSRGSYNLSGTGNLSTVTEYIGWSGTGTFAQSGGTNSIGGYLYMGANGGSSGTYNLSGTGQLSADIEEIGSYGTGTFTQTGGTNSLIHTVTYTGSIFVGNLSGSSGTYNLSGTGQLNVSYSECIGKSGTGTFTQTGGANNITSSTGMVLGSSSTGNGTYNLNGGSLTLKSLSKGSGAAAFNFGGGTLQAGDNFATTLPMTLTGNSGNANVDSAGHAVTFSGVLSGTGGLNKLGSGTLTLSATNTYSGNTLISGGTLLTNQAAALPGYDQSGKVTVNTGATLAVRAGAASGEWSAAEINTLQSSAMFQNGAFLGIDTTSNNFSYSNVLGGSLGLSKLGSNTLILTASNTYTGGTIINAGTLKLSGSDDRLATTGAITLKGGVLDLDFNNQHTSGNVSFQGGTVQNGSIIKTGGDYDVQAGTVSLVLSGAAGLTKTTTGTATLSASNAYTGATTISDGTLILSGGDDRLATTGAIQISAGVLDLGGNNQHTSGEVILGGDLFLSADGVDPSGDVVFQGGTVQGGTITHDGTDYDGRYGLVLANLAGSAGLTKTSTGTLTLCASNSYLSGTTIKGGVLSVSILANGGVNSGIGHSSSDVANLVLNGGALQYTGPAASTDRAFKLGLGASAGILDASGSGALNLTYTGTMGFYGASTIARTLNLTGANTGNNTLAAIIGNASADPNAKTSLVKSGSGTWVLTASNTYTGATTISNGILKVSLLQNGGAPSNIGSSSNVAGNLIIDGGRLSYIGGGNSTDRLFTLTQNGGSLDASGAGTLILTNTGSALFSGTGPRTLTLTGSNIGNNTLAAIIGNGTGGATSLVKSGLGAWVLTASNTFTGGTIINAGTLKLSGGDDRLAASGAITLNGGVLDLDFHTQHTSGNVNFQGGAVQNGTIFKTGADYNFQAGDISATLAGSVGLTKSSTGTVTLSASNSYTGGTAVNAGAVSISADANLGAISGKLALNGGTLLTSTGFSMDAARPIEITSNGGAIQVSPGQTLTLPGSYTLNGGLTVTGGGQLDLSLTSAATLSGSGSLSVAAGTTLSAGGTVDPFTDGVNSAIHAAVANDGQFNVTSGIKTTGDVTGSGTTSVTGAGTQLSVSVLHQSQLSIGADARLTIRGVASAPLSEGMYPSSLTPVPEPSTWALLLLAATGLGIYRVRQKGQSHFCCRPSLRDGARNRDSPQNTSWLSQITSSS